jgi:hypothetical protein
MGGWLLSIHWHEGIEGSGLTPIGKRLKAKGLRQKHGFYV